MVGPPGPLAASAVAGVAVAFDGNNQPNQGLLSWRNLGDLQRFRGRQVGAVVLQVRYQYKLIEFKD